MSIKSFYHCCLVVSPVRPAAYAHSGLKFPQDLPVGDERFFLCGIVSQVSQMDQQGQHIVLCLEGVHVILEALYEWSDFVVNRVA